MTTIVDVHAREILDSRGNPTLEAEVTLVERQSSAAPRCPRAPPPARARRSNCATATRRATSARACSKAVATSTATIAAALLGLRCRRPEGPRRRLIALDGTETRAPRRQRAARACRWRTRMPWRPRRAAAVAPSGGRRPRAGAAGADDEHHQRRRACRQQRRPAGIHGAAGRLRFFSEALRCGTEIFHALKSVLNAAA
jgi:enolase